MTPRRKIASRFALVALGTVAALAILEAGMRAAGYVMKRGQAWRNQQALGRKHDLRILCLGESTTAGIGENGSYPEMLEEILNGQRLGVRFAVVNRGRIGGTTNEIIASLASDLDDIRPDLVIAMMGINDGGRTQAYGSIIAPGANRWYGSFRVYKLYRLLRFGLGRRFSGDAGDPPTPAAPVDSSDQSEIPNPFPDVPQEVSLELQEASRLVEDHESEKAERILTDLIREKPQLAKPYAELARVYRATDRDQEAHQILERGIEAASPKALGLYHALALSHDHRGQRDAAVAAYRFILESFLEPSHIWDHVYFRVQLAALYEKNGQLDAAELTLAEITEKVDPWNDISYRYLIDFYDRHHKTEAAEAMRERQLRIQLERESPKTRANFDVLRKAVRDRGAKLIAVQYPGRSVETLKRILDYDTGVIYVDNGSFKDAVETEGYETLYVDRFAGDFGHLTETGNRRLAENVARTIVEELFGRPFAVDPQSARVDSRRNLNRAQDSSQ